MDMQNVKNLTIPEGAVRTIHDKDSRLIWGAVGYDTKYGGDTLQNGTPTPDAPIPVQVVTGAQTVEVHGKNLFDGTTPTTTQVASSSLSNDVVTISSTSTGVLPYCSWEIPVSQGDVVRINAIIKNPNGRMVKQTWNGSSWTAYAERNYTDGTSISSIEVTAGSSITKVRFNLYSNNVVTSGAASSNYENVVITKNEPNMTYEPYQSHDYTVELGSLELCKIGDYQDYIYKSDGNWYVHKETGNVTLDNNSFTGQTSTISGLQCIITTASTTPNKVSSGSAGTYCNKASMKRASDPLFANGCYYENPTNFVYAGSATDTYSDVVGKYSGAVLYYVLGTATDTQITDATLVTQLNAIHEWLTRYGYNSSVSGNLPLLIEQTNLS